MSLPGRSCGSALRRLGPARSCPFELKAHKLSQAASRSHQVLLVRKDGFNLDSPNETKHLQTPRLI